MDLGNLLNSTESALERFERKGRPAVILLVPVDYVLQRIQRRYIKKHGSLRTRGFLSSAEEFSGGGKFDFASSIATDAGLPGSIRRYLTYRAYRLNGACYPNK